VPIPIDPDLSASSPATANIHNDWTFDIAGVNACLVSSGTTTTGADGTFTIAGMPAGSYYAVAVSRLPADGDDAWQDPEYLRALIPRAVSVTLRDGRQTAVDLRLPTR
jgi:hypothetical protein